MKPNRTITTSNGRIIIIDGHGRAKYDYDMYDKQWYPARALDALGKLLDSPAPKKDKSKLKKLAAQEREASKKVTALTAQRSDAYHKSSRAINTLIRTRDKAWAEGGKKIASASSLQQTAAKAYANERNKARSVKVRGLWDLAFRNGHVETGCKTWDIADVKEIIKVSREQRGLK